MLNPVWLKSTGSDRSNRQFSERGEGVGAGPADGVAALAEA